ncbi:selenocysteine-specific translation elongation factor [Limosilactobacillus antri]|uniref:Selenocysteine-specific translation elongation factor n=2 Tax=Limosilactobacillus antri DSM 16041 TaxID=525309 RepID=C8P4J6_9LACO|nr:selenocysteine-specific translation elongation factor [Limosilactobacillus antri]EEW54616.1 selenocysteine-specific translation elongation factor [Limosilactobacillus antri DSM 16041]
MDYIVAATAGHVDHGKTTLIKRLTGIDTDTAPEEKKRGLTINLGFAYFDLPSKKRIAFVDVPGHEKFLKNMISGLTGIDMALLVVDAGEGVMPQTEEHAAILSLLGIKNFVIAVTKADTVDPEMCQLTIEDIREHFKNGPLEKAPLVVTDAVSGRGIKELIAVMDETASKIKKHRAGSNPRLNIDRVFTIKGHGTVVTGTLIDGFIKANDNLEIYPSQIPVRVKNIQVNDQDQLVAQPDHRVALNLDVKSSDIHKGEIVTVPGNVTSSKLLDVQLNMLPNVPSLKLNERFRLYVGSVEVFGRLYPMVEDEVKAGTNCLAQLRLETPVAVKNGDRFIVRTYSPMVTVAGGTILSANAKHHSRNNQSIINTLRIRAGGDEKAIIVDYLQNSGKTVATTRELASLIDVDTKELQKDLQQLLDAHQLVAIDDYYFTSNNIDNVMQQVVRSLADAQEKHPLRRGVPRPELISRLNKALQVPVGASLIKMMKDQEQVKLVNDLVATKEFKVVLTPQQEKLKAELLKKLNTGDLIPVSVEQLGEQSQVLPLLESFDGEDFVYLGDGYCLSWKTYQEIIQKVRNYLASHSAGIGLSEYRDLTESSRKYAIMVLERLDKDGVTKRMNRVHILNG